MKTIETTVYEFDELDDRAKEKARDWFREGFEFPWADECLQSLKALAEHFNGKVKDYSIDWFNSSYSSARFDMPEMEAGKIESRMADLGTFNPKTLKGHGDCKLTGYCADESAIDGFRKAWYDGERDLEKLMNAAFSSWLKDAQTDAQSLMEDESVDDSITANGYLFTKEGKRTIVV